MGVCECVCVIRVLCDQLLWLWKAGAIATAFIRLAV